MCKLIYQSCYHLFVHILRKKIEFMWRKERQITKSLRPINVEKRYTFLKNN